MLNDLRYPAFVAFKCPNCGGDISNFDVKIGLTAGWQKNPFQCPTCGSMLNVSRIYSWSVLTGCLWVSLAVPTLLRMSPWYLWVGSVIALWFVVGALAGIYVKILFPPKIIHCDPENLSIIGPGKG